MEIFPHPKRMFSAWFQKRWWIGLWAVWMVLGLAAEGCGGPRTPRRAKGPASSSEKQNSDTHTASTSNETPSVRLSPSQVRLRQVNKAGFDAWLQSQKGKVVLVDFWATWCMPCRELFPHTVQVHRKWASKGLVVAAVSFDDPEAEAEVRQFLAKQGADFENFLAVGPPEPFEAFQITGGAVPHFKIYGPDGRVLRTLASAEQNIEPADIDKAVQEALAALNPDGQTK